MKKIVIVILSLILCLSLSACAIDSIADAGQPDTVSLHNTVNLPEPAVSPSAVPSLSNGEAVLFDTGECSLTVLKITDELPDTFTFEFLLENKSDTDLDFYCDSFSVNGWQFDTFYYETVKAGKTIRDTLEYYPTEPFGLQPDSVNEISIVWYVTDAVDLLREPLVIDTFTFSAYGHATEGSEAEERPSSDSETVILDDESFTFVILEVSNDGLYGPEILCYLENKTEESVLFDWNDVSVNGWDLGYYFSQRIMPGCRTFYRVTFDENELALCGIEHILELCFELNVLSSESEIITSRSAALYPTGLTADDIPEPERVPKDDEAVLLDDERCTVIIEPAVRGDGTYVYGIYIRNKTGDFMEIYISDVVVNGDSDVLLFKYGFLPADCRSYNYINIYDFEFEDSFSDTPKRIEFKLELSCYNGYDMTIFFDETVTFAG